MMESSATRLGEILISKKLTLAVAESCTGGLLGGAVTAVAGSSTYFRGGVIAYDNDIKRDILGVQAADLEEHGAVSGPVAEAMAAGVAKLFNTDCAISVSGIAGPGGGTDQKPVGLVFIGIHFRGETLSNPYLFDGGREDVRSHSVKMAIAFCNEVIGC